MEGAEVTNGEAAAREEANEGKDAEEAVANQQRDEQLAVANGAALLQCSSNEDTEPRERSNDSKEPEAANGNAARKSPTNENTAHKSAINENTAHKSPANENTAQKPPTNENTAHKSPTNENTAQKSPANENTAHKSPTNEDRPATTNKDAASQDPTNQDGAGGAAANVNSTRQPPPNEDSPSQDPANDLAPLPAAANQPPDPWDWSLEEAWLREPEGEELEEEWAELDEQGADLEEQRAELEDEWAEPSHTESAARWWSSPDGTWSKLIVRPGRGLARPGPGSRCRVLLTVPRSGRRAPPSSASGSGRWLTVRVGAAEGRWSCLLDAALETMAGGELARVRPSGASAATVAVRLGRFTAAPPFWAASPSSRWRSVASGHARAAALLARGLLGAAARAYSRALRAAVLAAGAVSPPPEAAEVKAELHAGLALVQLRLGLPAAAAANAGKALALRPTHLEARYRRAVAQAAMMDLEAAMADLVAILRAQPGHAGARRELRRVRGAARERDARLARRLGRLFA